MEGLEALRVQGPWGDIYIYMYKDIWGLYKGPRTQIIGLLVPNTVDIVVFGP